ncbi:MAG TPA: NnrU family protein, partial [Methylomirabilota bacterium]|nr:NnrU family protein [Methylomirabilota bacterium]
MDATVWIALWAALFLGTHFALSSATVRPGLVSAVGSQGFLGIYSLVAFATLGPLIYEFAYYKH